MRPFVLPLAAVIAATTASPALAAYGPERIVTLLEQRGYRDIRFTDRQLPGYGAEGCLGADKLELRLNRWGDIVNRRRIGSCTDTDEVEEGPREIRAILEGRGFSRLDFIDATPPRYVVEACRNARRLRLDVNRFGDIAGRERIGRCDDDAGDDEPPAEATDRASRPLPRLFDSRASRQQIENVLTAQGYSGITFKGREFFRFVVTACRAGSLQRLVLNRFGEVRRAVRIGACEEPREEYVDAPAPQRYARSEIRAKGRVRPELCQDYFDWLLHERTILFDTASARLRGESTELLDDLAYVAGRCPEATVEISGHTDADGSFDYNQDLAERRAESVVAYLDRQGVDQDRLFAVGYGEQRPVASNRTEPGKQRNRRIEFSVRWE